MTRMTGPDCVVMCNLINTYIHIHTYIHINTLATTIGALLSLQPMIPPGCLQGRSRCVQIVSLKTYQYSTTQVVQLQRQSVVQNAAAVRSHRNELHNSPVRKHVILLQQGQFALRTSSTV